MIKGRTLALVAASLGLLGASPAKRAPAPLLIPEYSDDFAATRAPPPQQSGYQAAPMPNDEVSAPAAAPKTGTRIGPKIFNQRAFNGGQGYVPGSTIEGQQEQRQKPIPGLNLDMPLP